MTKKYEMPKGSLISFMSNKVKTHGGINFAQGIPGFQPPEKLLENLTEVAAENVHQYAPGIGNLKLRKLILDHYKELNFTENQLLVTQGATEALSLIFQYLKNLINKDFTALAFDPVYESYRHLPRIMGVNFVSYSQEHFDIEKFEIFVRSEKVGVIFINSPGNPYGSVFSRMQMNQMKDICEKLGIYMVIDAVYRDLWFNEPPFYPLENLSPNIFYVNSFSKMLSVTGWRIGYLFCNEQHTEALRDIHDYIGLCVNAPLQEALAQYLEENNYGKLYVTNLRKQLQKNYRAMEKALTNLGFHNLEASGGYYVWTKLPENRDGFQFTMELYEKAQVAVIPGIHFSESGEQFIRINIARPENELNEGINRIKSFFQ